MAIATKLYAVEVTAHSGDTFTAQDSATSKAGTNALEKIKHEETVIIKRENDTVYIPWHSVVSAVVTASNGSIDMTDSQCVSGSEDGNEESNSGSEAGN